MAVATMCSSQAADLAVRPYYTKAAPPMAAAIYDWTGLYLGVNAGYASAHSCWTVSDLFPESCHRASGATAGGQLGYRWQVSSWVFGVEGQGDWADLSGNSVANTPDVVYTNGAKSRTKIDSFAMLTGSAGVALNNVLLYVKGGGAYVDSKYNHIGPAYWRPNPAIPGSASATRLDPVAGVGIEWGFAQNWSVGAEYNHVFQSSKGVNMNCEGFSVCPGSASAFHMTQDLDMALVRLNYRFGAR